MKSDLETRLLLTRKKHERTLAIEKERLDEEMNQLKLTHMDKVSEIKNTQIAQIEDMQVNHKDTLDKARQKFRAALKKYESLD